MAWPQLKKKVIKNPAKFKTNSTFTELLLLNIRLGNSQKWNIL